MNRLISNGFHRVDMMESELQIIFKRHSGLDWRKWILKLCDTCDGSWGYDTPLNDKIEIEYRFAFRTQQIADKFVALMNL